MTTKKTTTEDPTLAEVVGGGFAVLQHGIDKVVTWGFRKMKDVQQGTDPEKDIENPHLQKAAKLGRGLLGFVADAGQAYYKSYEELKKKSADGR